MKYGIDASTLVNKNDSVGMYIPVNSGNGLPLTTNSKSEFVCCVAGVIDITGLDIPLCSIIYDEYLTVKFLSLLVVSSVGVYCESKV